MVVPVIIECSNALNISITSLKIIPKHYFIPTEYISLLLNLLCVFILFVLLFLNCDDYLVYQIAVTIPLAPLGIEKKMVLVQ